MSGYFRLGQVISRCFVMSSVFWLGQGMSGYNWLSTVRSS